MQLKFVVVIVNAPSAIDMYIVYFVFVYFCSEQLANNTGAKQISWTGQQGIQYTVCTVTADQIYNEEK